eukprot:37328-Pleurochrysis_carterae.AAC.1
MPTSIWECTSTNTHAHAHAHAHAGASAHMHTNAREHKHARAYTRCVMHNRKSIPCLDPFQRNIKRCLESNSLEIQTEWLMGTQLARADKYIMNHLAPPPTRYVSAAAAC